MINLNEVIWTRDIDTTDQDVQGIAASIGNVGLLQPILLREISVGKKKQLEVVDGRARVEALISIQRYELDPEQYRILNTDDPNLISFVANFERRQSTPLVEAEKIAQLQLKHDVAEISSILGRSEKFVRSRISLNNLIPKFKEHYLQGTDFPALKLCHYQVLAGYPQDTQKHILKAADHFLRYPGYVQSFVTRLDNEFSHRLADAPFLDDKCQNCEERSLAEPWLFDQLKDPDADRCLNPDCWAKRMTSHIKAERKRIIKDRKNLTAAESGKSDVKIISNAVKPNPDADLQRQDFEIIHDPDAEPNAFIIDGENAGRHVRIRQNDNPANKPEPTSPQTLKDKREKLNKRREKRAMEKLFEFISHDRGDLPLPKQDLFIRLIGVFGVSSAGEWNGDQFFRPGLDGAGQVAEYAVKDIKEKLWVNIKKDIASRIQSLTNNTLDHLHTDQVVNVCTLLGINWQEYLNSAIEEIPEPASWASDDVYGWDIDIQYINGMSETVHYGGCTESQAKKRALLKSHADKILDIRPLTKTEYQKAYGQN